MPDNTAAAAHRVPSMSILGGYRPTAIFDELIRPDGQTAPHWFPILAGLEALTHEQRIARTERIDMRVREIGIAHDLFADPSRSLQPWHLDIVPLVFPADEWALIETAVVQRARLLEAILADIYGPQDLMRRGVIPPQLVFADPSYLRACHGIQPLGARIQFFAADLTRGPDGTWRIVDTHTETPAGIAYALANRTIITHVCGDIFNASRAIRLAHYFERMQEALAQRINRPDPSTALLTPGPHHSDFFSHAYLARYLGALLVEGDDLCVDNDRIHLKTLDGLQPIDLILRCAAADCTDALELDPSGFLGPVGLVQAVRRQPDFIVNALGTAIVENRGLGPYLPQACRQLLGEDLVVADVAKCWLGDPDTRRSVIANLNRYFIRQAFERTGRPGGAAPGRDPIDLTAEQRATLIEQILVDGHRLVAEEKFALSTTPSFSPHGLEPKPYVLRVFATAVQDDFIVMPGGLAMTVDPGVSMALTAPDGASRDVWVLSDAPQPVFKSLWLGGVQTAQVQRGPREMPSRAAENMFWLGRHVEHADWIFRLLRNCLARIEEDGGPRQSLHLPRVALMEELKRDNKGPTSIPQGLAAPQEIACVARLLMTSPDHTYGLPQTLAHIRRLAGLTRDRLSLEAWRTLNVFHVGRRWQYEALPASIGESLDLIDAGLGVIAAFNGLSHENMTRNHGWTFLDMGRRLVRAHNMSRTLLAGLQSRDEGLDEVASLFFILELADSFITYRSRYRIDPLLAPVLDLLIADETNPRSLAFQLAAIAGHIDTLPQTGRGGRRDEGQRLILALLNEVRLADVASLTAADGQGRCDALAAMFRTQVERIPLLCDVITRRYFNMVEKEPHWVKTRSRQTP